MKVSRLNVSSKSSCSVQLKQSLRRDIARCLLAVGSGALLLAPTAVLAEETVCFAKGNNFLAECGVCPPGSEKVSGPNIAKEGCKVKRFKDPLLMTQEESFSRLTKRNSGRYDNRYASNARPSGRQITRVSYDYISTSSNCYGAPAKAAPSWHASLAADRWSSSYESISERYSNYCNVSGSGGSIVEREILIIE